MSGHARSLRDQKCPVTGQARSVRDQKCPVTGQARSVRDQKCPVSGQARALLDQKCPVLGRSRSVLGRPSTTIPKRDGRDTRQFREKGSIMASVAFQPVNPHETSTALATAFVAGAASLFTPDLVQSGGGNNQPMDLAWVCEDLVLAFYCKQTGPERPAGTATPKYEKSIDGNLRQAAGWLKKWKNGQPLKATNEYGPIELSYSPSLAVGIVSVVDGATTVVRSHPEFREEHGVHLAITLPLAGLCVMGGYRFNLYDVVDVLKRVEALPASSQNPQMLDLMSRGCFEHAVRTSSLLSHFPEGLSSRELFAHDSAFLGMKSVSPDPAFASVSNPSVVPRITPYVTDMPLVDSFGLCIAVKTLHDRHHKDNMNGCIVVRGRHHDHIVASSPSGQHNSVGRIEGMKALQAALAGKLRPGLFATYWCNPWSASIVPSSPIKGLYSAKVLRNGLVPPSPPPPYP
jgi:hypothetical protein